MQVLVDHLVRSLDRKIISNRQLMHVYEFAGAFITRMTIVELDRPAGEDDEEDA